MAEPQLPEIEIHSTWRHPRNGTLWHLVSREHGESYRLRPDYGYSLNLPVGTPDHVIATSGDLLRIWTLIETHAQRHERLARERDIRCALSQHDDPDTSGLCIHCSAVL